MNEPISLSYHEAQAVAERLARLRRLARHRGSGAGPTGRERAVLTIGNPYYAEPNPANHGLYLHIEGRAGAPVPLFAKDLGYERNFEAARLPARDQYGHVQHPDMDGIGWDEFDMGPQLRALGWQSKTVCFEDDADEAMQDRYSEGGSPDCSYWTPTPPEGAGWLLAAIYDTEDGPVAMYVRATEDPATVGALDALKQRATNAEDAYLNMRQWAEHNGVDTTTRNGGTPQGPRVLNALEVLERLGISPTCRPATAADFLRWLGEHGMWVMENPLAEHTAAAHKPDSMEGRLQ